MPKRSRRAPSRQRIRSIAERRKTPSGSIALAEAVRFLNFARIAPEALGGLSATARAGRVRAWLTATGRLFVTGLEDWSDWPLAEGQKPPLRGAASGWDGLDRRIATGLWHPDTLRRARLLRQGLGDFSPRIIVARSLGAAPAQLLGLHYGVPVIAFGATGVLPADAKSLVGERAMLTLLHARDPLAHDVPAGPGYRRLGRLVRIGDEAPPGIRHDLASYRTALEAAQAADLLPAAWP